MLLLLVYVQYIRMNVMSNRSLAPAPASFFNNTCPGIIFHTCRLRASEAGLQVNVIMEIVSNDVFLLSEV